MPQFESIQKLQAGLFIPKPDFLISRKLINHLNNTFMQDYQLAQIPIEIPFDAPVELPRLIFTNPNQTWQCSVSFLRCDVRYFPYKAATFDEEVINQDDFIDRALNMFNVIIPSIEFEINRIALISELIVSISEDEAESPVRYVQNNFIHPNINSELVQNLHNAEVNLYQRTDFETESNTFNINYIVKIKSFGAPDTENKLLYQIDINTIQDNQDIRYTMDQVSDYFNYMKTRIREIISVLIQ